MYILHKHRQQLCSWEDSVGAYKSKGNWLQVSVLPLEFNHSVSRHLYLGISKVAKSAIVQVEAVILYNIHTCMARRGWKRTIVVYNLQASLHSKHDIVLVTIYLRTFSSLEKIVRFWSPCNIQYMSMPFPLFPVSLHIMGHTWEAR